MRSVSSETVERAAGAPGAARGARPRSRGPSGASGAAILIWAAAAASTAIRGRRRRRAIMVPDGRRLLRELSMRTRSRFLFFGMMVLGVVLGLFLSLGPAAGRSRRRRRRPCRCRSRRRSAVDRAAAEPAGLDAEERHTIALFKDVSRSVAFITTQVEQVDFWTRSVAEVPAGTGSGFVWDDAGPRRHELPRGPERRHGQGDGRRRRVPGQARRLLARAGPRGAADRRRPREARPHPRRARAPTCRSARRSTRSATRSASTTR